MPGVLNEAFRFPDPVDRARENKITGYTWTDPGLPARP